MYKELFWSKNMNLGLLFLDDDHKGFILLINDLYKAYYQKDLVLASQILQRCLFHQKNHFSKEEMVMEQIQFPDLISHKKSHQQFLENILELIQSFEMAPKKEEKEKFLLQTADYLKSWFLGHVLSRDRLYKPYLVRLYDCYK